MNRYTVLAWIFDRRCNDDCRLTTYNTDSYEDAVSWTGKIKKAFGDSVKLIDRETGKEGFISLREDQMV